MKRILLLTSVLISSLFSCESDEKAIEIVLNDVKRGAVLRTVGFNNGEFEVGVPDSVFSVILEEQDIEEGGVMNDVTVYVSFIDNTPGLGAMSTNRIVLETILPDAFTTGANGLPVMTLAYTFQELLEATGVSIGDVFCKDQFRIDLDLNLTSGETFNLQNSAGTVVNTTGFFKSPYTYLINVVEPIATDLFTGVYQLTSIQDALFGATFAGEDLVTIRNGHSNNVRVFEIAGAQSFNLEIEFSVVCDATIVTRYQRIRFGCTDDLSDRILIGPDEIAVTVDPNDDTVFELHILEAFEGFNAMCDYENSPSKVRFSKQ